MTPGERDEECKGSMPEAAGGEGMDALPDGVLAHILGFLPAEEAVRTCVLARRWRHLWKSATGLRVVAADGRFLGTVEKLQEFVGRLLPLLEGAPLDTCVLELGSFGVSDRSWHHGGDILRGVSTWFWHAVSPWHPLEDKTLVSSHLTRLELNEVGPVEMISSNCLSEATNLMLISEPKLFIFRMDLRWCPTFSKLKTLLLNDYWCVPDDFLALACILEHSPVLEKLSLLFSKEPKHEVELEGSISPTESSAAISEHLKTVKVECDGVDDRILKVILFLRMFNIRLLVLGVGSLEWKLEKIGELAQEQDVSGKSKRELLSHYVAFMLQVAFD
ncbi:hypothetical protein ACP70R_003784 [Stipagrostis hirtigluma subsp. patula]